MDEGIVILIFILVLTALSLIGLFIWAFTSVNKTQKAYERIAKELGITKTEAKAKIHAFRAHGIELGGVSYRWTEEDLKFAIKTLKESNLNDILF